ncbi:MAG: hypothetical protein GY820_37065 [Gammaproteobacteria bacterium]|nr:hypothetical protein [Gammaproteobacteria bacterium]
MRQPDVSNTPTQTPTQTQKQTQTHTTQNMQGRRSLICVDRPDGQCVWDRTVGPYFV